MPTYLSPGVYVEEVASGSRPIEGAGTSVAAFVGLAPAGPLNEAVLVTNWSQYTSTFGEFTEDYALAHAVYGYFNNGGTTAYVVRVGGGTAGAGERTALAAAERQAPLGAFRVRALEGAQLGGAPRIEVSAPAGEGADDRFTLTVKDGDQVLETFEVSSKKSNRNYVVTQVKQRSKLITVEEAVSAGQLARPENGTVALEVARPSLPVPAQESLTSGHFLGDAADRTGFGGLEALDAVTMVAVPDLMVAYERGALDMDAVKAVQLGMIAHCELMGDRMAILDPPPGMNAKQIRDWRQDTAGYDSSHAALYYPWIKVLDPSSGRQRLVPPSGHMAGIWSRNDSERGVHKAPANEIVRGAVDLGLQITRGEQDLLNPIGVNCIRAFPGRGIRVWGARTAASDPAWRYLNVRRYFNYLEESILAGTQWVVFEPNDEALWARIRRNVSAFLVNEWRAGALFGARPEEAFYVKCDAETNPPESVEAGRVVCEVGIAPVKPAEFVVFRLAQFSDGTGELAE
ncbi:phage tail sheath subtilisin-like domain-containing protein [Streptomyces gibsoniae]|uniref:Phage tail sheath subtilisin-like domain-containing protein n=1 Tax=Streptomyces gibsoniae TaxID=3075529 RepID=A0ABU2U4D4_9ACTN|nr:phage tail sheath subtilisin-like domain-containing protein [Streptomyces sp. DSM 41699]MDT0468096.1 phage tail sheath subtilisin-like domain-containing protein [Streptomyces sp. DSM 41699]